MQGQTDGRQSSASEAASLHFGTERIRRFLLISCELLLIATIVRLFRIEEQRHLFPLLCLVLAGFGIHIWLRPHLRMPFLALLSMTCVLALLGAVNGFTVLMTGGVLIVICRLPLRFELRIVLLIVTVAALVILRVLHPIPFWPVLGSMFMFRLICFAAECRRTSEIPGPAISVSYFFMFPNSCFLLFPVVDFRRFRDSWYSTDEWETYQRGIVWMTWGLIHLLLYRFLRHSVVPEYTAVHDVPGMAFLMVTNYALYLQVSGQFHLIAGVLHLFGFNLGRTHELYFLASGFADIWRRINIYWKDFMMRFFFFPAFFFLRGRGATVGSATVVSILLVFFCTWLLHSWQTFWLLGRFPLTANDAFLWLSAGICMAVGAGSGLYRGRSARRQQSSVWGRAVGLSLRTVTMFLLVSLFWACWTRPGFLRTAGRLLTEADAGRGALVVLLWISAAVAIGAVCSRIHQRRVSGGKAVQPLDFRSSAQLHLVLLGLTVAAVYPFGALLSPQFAAALGEFRMGYPSAEVQGERLLSYYEDLNEASIQAGPLIRSLSPEQEVRREQAHGFYKVSRQADAYQQIELIPGIRTELEGSPFSVNQFGMRDRESVSRKKASGTIRIALSGSSIVMGYGVPDDRVFSRVFESALNETAYGNDNHQRDAGPRYEVLNFGVGKHWAPHRLIRMQRLVVSFKPDAIFYFAHQDEFRELASHTAHLVSSRLELPSVHLQRVADMAMVTAEMPPGGILSRLLRYETELLSAVYLTIAETCRSRGIVADWIYLPVPGDVVDVRAEPDPQAVKLISLAEAAGFIVADLSDWTETREGLFPSSTDHHPNVEGHRLIAEALLRMIARQPETLPGVGERGTGVRFPLVDVF